MDIEYGSSIEICFLKHLENEPQLHQSTNNANLKGCIYKCLICNETESIDI